MSGVIASPRMIAVATRETEPDVLIEVKSGAGVRTLRVNEIGFVESCENYTRLTLAANHRLLVRRTMQQWVTSLPGTQFARVHRGLIVNLEGIATTERDRSETTRVSFKDRSLPSIEVKRRHWPGLRRRLDAWRSARLAQSAKAIAVLPFVQLGRDSDSAAFCDGVTEELLNVLAKVPGLRVAARTSSFYFKNKNCPIAEIAEQLGVAYVVEGSVRRNGRRVRIAAQLIAAADGFRCWSEVFDRELTDLFAVQDDIARLIVESLQLKLTTAERRRAVHPEAHRLLLEGRHFWNQRTAEGLARADAAFHQALALDPEFAAGYAGLADLSVVRAMYRLADGDADVSEDLTRADEHARRALQLDPTLAEPHAALGFTCFHGGRLAETEPHFHRALAANPSCATGYQFHAWSLAGQGRLRLALGEYAKAIALDPLSFVNLDRYATMLSLAGRFREAFDANVRAAALRSDVYVGNVSQRAMILLLLGHTAEAIEMARAVRSLSVNVPFRRNADVDAIFVLHQAGCTVEAENYASEALSRLAPGNYLRGFIHCAVGQFAEGFANLRTTPPIMLPQLYWSPIWQKVQMSPPFRKLMRALGRLAEYETAQHETAQHETAMPADEHRRLALPALS